MDEDAFENEIAALELERDELRKLVKMGEAIIEEIMPQIGQLVIQDFARLNEFLVGAAKIKAPE